MKNHDLLNILSAFNKEELTRFGKFVRSPFFNNQKTLIRLFDELAPYHPLFNDPGLTNEKIFSVVSGRKNYNDVLFRKYLSELTRLADEFLIYISATGNELTKKRDLLYEYYKRGLNKRYSRLLAKMEEDIAGCTTLDEELCLSLHMLEEIKINYSIKNDESSPPLQMLYDTQYHLLNYFLNLIGNNISEMNNLISPDEILQGKNVISSFIRNFRFSEFMQDAVDDGSRKYIMLRISYLNIMMILYPDDESYYYDFKVLLKKNSSYLSMSLGYVCFMKLLNYCITRSNRGMTEYQNEFIEIYTIALKDERYIRLIKNNLPYSIFRYAVRFSLELGRVEWAQWFIDNFINLLSSKNREEAANFAEAYMSFIKCDYNSSLSSISKIKSKNQLVRIDIDMILSKIYYEMDYIDSCYSLADSFTNLVKNTKTLKDKSIYLNYIKYYKQLTGIKSGKKNPDADVLIQNLQSEKKIKTSDWLIEKAKDLASKNN